MSSGSNSRIFLSTPHMGGTELKYINQAFEQNWIAPMGPNVINFEKDLSDYLGGSHVAALNSGTAAIHLALINLGVGPGDYVIAQSFTFSATINPIVYLGATPVLIDSVPDTWNMDTALLEKAILDCIEGSGMRDQKSGIREKGTGIRKKPKAIIPVHLYGMPANLERIMAIAEKYDIPVIEDAAESLGSRYKGKHVGTFGKMGVLSFNGNKIITTSGGGALISDDEELIKKTRFLSTQARDKAPHYQHTEIGYNYRISNIVAGIGRGQMEILDERIKQRRSNYLFYEHHLSGIDGITLVKEPGEEYFFNRWLTTILIDQDKTGITGAEIMAALEKENIESRPLWKPMHLQPVFKNCPAYVNGVSEGLFKKGLCLPSGSNMTDEDKERVIRNLLKLFKGRKGVTVQRRNEATA